MFGIFLLYFKLLVSLLLLSNSKFPPKVQLLLLATKCLFRGCMLCEVRKIHFYKCDSYNVCATGKYNVGSTVSIHNWGFLISEKVSVLQ